MIWVPWFRLAGRGLLPRAGPFHFPLRESLTSGGSAWSARAFLTFVRGARRNLRGLFLPTCCAQVHKHLGEGTNRAVRQPGRRGLVVTLFKGPGQDPRRRAVVRRCSGRGTAFQRARVFSSLVHRSVLQRFRGWDSAEPLGARPKEGERQRHVWKQVWESLETLHPMR